MHLAPCQPGLDVIESAAVMRLVPILFPSDLARSDRGSYVSGGERGAPDVVLDHLESEGVRFARPIPVVVDVPSEAEAAESPLKFDAAIAKAVQSLAEVVKEVNSDANFPVILGGDHLGMCGHVLGHSVRHEEGIGLAVMSDAFVDLETPAPPAYDKSKARKDPEVSSTGEARHMVLAGALGLIDEAYAFGKTMKVSAVEAKHTSVVGVRGSLTARVKQQLKSTKIDVWDMERLELDGESDYRSMLNRHLSAGPIALSLDVTGLDPDLMMAVKDAPSDGLDWKFLKRSLEQCIPHVDRVLGLDICGVDPTQDSANHGGMLRFAEAVGPFLRRLTR